MEAIPQGEWNGMCSEEAEFMAELLGNCSLPNEVLSDTNFVVSPTFWATHESNRNIDININGVVDEAVMYSSDDTNTTSFSLFPFSSQETYYSTLSLTNNNLMTMDYSNSTMEMEEEEEGKNGFQLHTTNNNINVMGLMGGDDFLNRDVSNDSTESNNEMKLEFGRGLVVPREQKSSTPSQSKKRCRLPCEVPRSNKSMKCSKCPRIGDSDDDNNNNNAVMVHRQTSSSCCSEDESNELNGTTSCSSSRGRRAPNPNGKTRASRGSATDPQSLYARKRRERINERLKILQTLVPNGTKVDISTMLEEAVEYVKFLQLQIKLLSSDDLWMYSPIAYNGMDIGLDLRISTARPQPS